MTGGVIDVTDFFGSKSVKYIIHILYIYYIHDSVYIISYIYHISILYCSIYICN